jgi:hypothetical protein
MKLVEELLYEAECASWSVRFNDSKLVAGMEEVSLDIT